MRTLILPVLATTISVASAFAAFGVALYGHGNPWQAGMLYGGFGLAAGLVCGVLDLAWRQLPGGGRRDPHSGLIGAGANGLAHEVTEVGSQRATHGKN